MGVIPRLLQLFQKKEGICGISKFRPVSLIGSWCKIIAKVLARRMKEEMGKVIGIEQSACVRGKFILDGVTILNELMEVAKSFET